MKTVIRRYDTNGAWTHDEEVKEGLFKPLPNSMWRVYKILEEIDYDRVLNDAKKDGWGDLSAEWFETFEESRDYKNPINTDEYSKQFLYHMNKHK